MCRCPAACFSSRIQNFRWKPLCRGGSRLGHVTGCSCVSQPGEGTGYGKVSLPWDAACPCQELGGCSRCLPAQPWGRVLGCFVSLIYTSIVTRFSYLYIDSAEQVLQQPVKKLCACPQARRHLRGVLRERWPTAEATEGARLPSCNRPLQQRPGRSPARAGVGTGVCLRYSPPGF